MAIATTVAAETQVKPYTEFVRALNLVEQTQLNLFTDTLPPSKEMVIAQYNEHLTELKQQSDNKRETIDKESIKIMRRLLAKTLDNYNDQYANYITPDQLKKYNSKRNGSFVGVGLKFRAFADEYPVAIGPLLGGPMESLDIAPGDKLIDVDGTDLKGLSSSDIVKALKGPANTVTTLTVKRNDTTHQLVVTRSAVELHYASSELLQHNIGYIKVSRFGANTHTRVQKQLEGLIADNAQAIVLDLRDNPGGSTRAARAIVSMFTDETNVYCEKHKAGVVKNLPRHGAHITDLPLAVLINGNSMSASEIVAGAIQSYSRGDIIGSPSFGKGLVQKVFNLKAPLGGAVRTTIAVFGRPDHQLIHATGIVPDYYIETESDFMFRRTGSLNISADAKAYRRELLEQSITEKQPDRAAEHIAARDQQLQTAIDRLKLAISETGKDAVQEQANSN